MGNDPNRAAAKAKAARKRKNDKERRRAAAPAMGDDYNKENSAKSGSPDGALSKARTSTCVNHDVSYTAEPSAGSVVPDAVAAVATAFGFFEIGPALATAHRDKLSLRAGPGDYRYSYNHPKYS